MLWSYWLQQFPHFVPAQVLPPGLAPNAKPHRALVDCLSAEAGEDDAGIETEIEVERTLVRRVVDLTVVDRTGDGATLVQVP